MGHAHRADVHVRRPPGEVFACIDDPANLASSQPSKSRAGRTAIVDGSMPVDGRWTFEDDGAGGSRVRFVAEAPMSGPRRLVEPLVRRGVDRSFRHYHELLARQVEARGAAPTR
jgi:hypothetical protein